MTPFEEPKTQADVRAQYAHRLKQRRAELDYWTRTDVRLGNAKLIVFGMGLLIAWAAFGYQMFSPWWLLVPLVIFTALVIAHDRPIRHRERATRAVAFYTVGLERLDGRWTESGATGVRFLDSSHSYAADLDLFGRASLFQRLCTTRTRVGEECLADWLRAAAAPDVVRQRQQAVEELRPRLDLREELALLGEEARSAVHPKALAAWGSEPLVLTDHRLRLTATLLSAVTLVALVRWGLRFGLLPLVILVTIEGLFERSIRNQVGRVVMAVERPAKDLALLASLLARLEREPFETPRLRELCAMLDTDGVPPSVRISRLETLVEYLHSQQNMIFVPIAKILLWTTQFAFAIEGWRAKNGPYLEPWLRVIGEFEALSALAGYAYEHPEDPFPEIVEQEVCFEAEGLAHPLLPATEAVPNDVRLGDHPRLLIVSGSNMSGKSTLLRTVGANVVLALAGAPVRAKRMRLSSLSLGASIRTQDSLQAGVSRFYAEITRLRQIVEIADQHPPLLFLLDEILHGTNSHDRRVGAEAIVRALIRRGAVGLITTHDLALARIAEEEPLHAINVHFEDHLEEGKMSFDYHLRPGVVEKSNAIALMRAVGLEV